MRRCTILLACFALQPALPAQGSANAALTVRTNSADLAANMVSSFDPGAEAPEWVEGSHIVLTLDDGGMINASVEAGEAPFLSLQANPGQLMDIFADQVGEAEQMAQMLGGVAGMQAGLGGSDVSQILGSVFSFPRQIEALTLIVKEDPSANFSIDATIQLNPKSGTWFGELMGNARAHPKGLLRGFDPQAMINIESNLDISKLGETLRPFFALSSKMTAKPGDDLAKATDYFDAYFKSVDGTMSMNFNPGQSGMVGITGLRDEELAKKLLHGGALAELLGIQQRKNRMIEFEIEDNAFEHRDVKIVKVIQSMEGMGPMGGVPFFDEDGSMTSLYAVTGESMLMASTGAEIAEMKFLIDSVTDRKLKRKALGPDILAQTDIRLAELVEFFSQMVGQGMGVTLEMPEHLSVLMKKVDNNLRIEVTTK